MSLWNFLVNTLLLYIPLLTLTHRQNDIQRNKLILVGLGNLRFLQLEKRIHLLRMGWRNFFSSCAVVSVFGSGGKLVLVLYVLPTEQELIPEY